MDGLFGMVPLGRERLDAIHEFATRATPTEAPAIQGPGGVIFAGRWAESLHGPDGVYVAGAAHLVNRAELAAACGVARPLEIAAAVYRAQGPEGLTRLRGQFCIAVLDTRAERLVLVTDRFATRPLYHARNGDTLVFGSSVSRVAAERSKVLDYQAILDYLLHDVIPAPRTPFVNVRKLPAGHVLIADRAGIRTTSYWDMVYPESSNGGSATWAGQLRAEIEAAVGRYVAAEESSDAMGAFLSGGTDSSTVSGMIGRITGRPAQTFSIGYVEQDYDELFYARVASRWFGTVLHEWKLSPAEAFDALPAVVAYYEEPFGNASTLPTYRCAQLAREHGVSVLFAGDGGDELFAGNERYRTDKIFGLYQRVPERLRRHLTDPFIAALPDRVPVLGRARRYVRRSNIPNPQRFFSYHLLLSESLAALLAPEFLAAVDPDQLLMTAEAHFNRPPAGTTELNRLLYLDLKLAIADNDVRKVSGMAELAGIEVRYPFLDTQLAEFSGRIPTGLKLHGLQKRYLFKQALADFLPPEILSKPKHGFGAPVALWMKHDTRWREFVSDVLHDRRTMQRGYFLPSVLNQLQQQHDADGTTYYGEEIWNILMLELWHREHVDAR